MPFEQMIEDLKESIARGLWHYIENQPEDNPIYEKLDKLEERLYEVIDQFVKEVNS